VHAEKTGKDSALRAGQPHNFCRFFEPTDKQAQKRKDKPRVGQLILEERFLKPRKSITAP
jgi:hypothetical protein